VLVADNLRSANNVGAILRTADGAGVSHVHLCGISATPAHRGVRKTALGAEESVSWSWCPDATTLIDGFTIEHREIWALEDTPDAVDLDRTARRAGPRLALIVGNEVSGVDPTLLEQSTVHVRLPMRGNKDSLNVAVAAGVAAYLLTS